MPEHQHAVLTGPIRGSVTLADGTEVDVQPDVVYLDTLDQAHEVAHLIGERYAAEGHPQHAHGDKFVHDVKRSKANFAAAKKEQS